MHNAELCGFRPDKLMDFSMYCIGSTATNSTLIIQLTAVSLKSNEHNKFINIHITKAQPILKPTQQISETVLNYQQTNSFLKHRAITHYQQNLKKIFFSNEP